MNEIPENMVQSNFINWAVFLGDIYNLSNCHMGIYAKLNVKVLIIQVEKIPY
ncbi:hypothetical protein SAMN05421676_105191 [Salinibacillus kushneri]|uniref:Uncharacterized protein n=1 Tax=Salinibacillus kushneri TaxID=237682 RepID=A0A1I0F4H9_9BACI|nr:hypothetical protein SAMN05421676_105191 [Salinibacillus kushneri]